MNIVNFGVSTIGITPSELNNLVTQPVVILDGQKDSILVPHRVICSYFAGGQPYSIGASNLTFAISDLIFGLLNPTVLSSKVNTSCIINVSNCQSVETESLINQPLLLNNLGKELSDGDGTLKIFVWYSTIVF